MTQEEKQLLFKDLCGRLPYGVICKLSAKDANVSITEKLDLGGLEHFIFGTMDVLPYLRPMSSMTEDEINEFILISDTVLCVGDKRSTCILSLEQMDWLNKKMFDFRGLIPVGLALEAPEGMYKTE